MDGSHRGRKTTGFTLVELLIVVGIVAVIAAILFPIFAGVRERGRRTVCQSNLKQLALAMQQYVQDNNGIYPPNADWGYAPYSYLKNVDVFRCPDYPADQNSGNFSLEAPVAASPDSLKVWIGTTAPTDYTYNTSRLMAFGTRSVHGEHETSFVALATIGLNSDSGWFDRNGVEHDFRVIHTSCGRDFGGSTLHSGAGNYSYVDGHVKWLTPEEAGEIECANGPLPAPFKD